MRAMYFNKAIEGLYAWYLICDIVILAGCTLSFIKIEIPSYYFCVEKRVKIV